MHCIILLYLIWLHLIFPLHERSPLFVLIIILILICCLCSGLERNELSKCCLMRSLLIHYSFWNAGLTEESLALLAGSLDACKCLNYLSVEANIPTLANFYLLTDSDSSVKYLYLRYNKIDSHTLLRVVQVILILINRCNSKENNS